MAFSPFEGGRGDETFPRHPGSFIPLAPFKGGKCFASVCYGVKECLPRLEKGFEIASKLPYCNKNFFNMKNSFLKSFPLLALAASWTMGCTPSCGDPALVAIPAADATAPTGKWMVSVLTVTPSGPISSMTPYEDPSNTLSVKTTDEVTVQWVVTDEESGIKTTSMEGSWVQACSTPSGPISATALRKLR